MKKTTTLTKDVKFLRWYLGKLKFTDWEIEVLDYLEKHPNVKKIWLVSNVRKTGATYFSKLLMFFREPNTRTYFISHNMKWSECVAKRDPNYEILFDFDDFKASNFLTPITLRKMKEEIVKDGIGYDCIYDNDFNVDTYYSLCNYNFDLLIINISAKDLEAAKPYIEAANGKEDVYIKYIDDQLNMNEIRFTTGIKLVDNV